MRGSALWNASHPRRLPDQTFEYDHSQKQLLPLSILPIARLDSPKMYSTSSFVLSYKIFAKSVRLIEMNALGFSLDKTPTLNPPITSFSSSTNKMSWTSYFSSWTRGQSPIRYTTSTPIPLKSIMYPPSRRFGARSITVGLKPYRLSQYASVGPAMPAPEMRMFVTVIAFLDSL